MLRFATLLSFCAGAAAHGSYMLQPANCNRAIGVGAPTR